MNDQFLIQAINEVVRSNSAQCLSLPQDSRFKYRSTDLFAHNLLVTQSFCAKQGRFCKTVSAVLCAKYQNDKATETDVMDERNFARFVLKTSFGRLTFYTSSSLRFVCFNRHIVWHLWSLTVSFHKYGQAPGSLFPQKVFWKRKKIFVFFTNGI